MGSVVRAHAGWSARPWRSWLGELAGNLKLVKVDAEENPLVSRRFEVQSIPTLVLLDHGEVVDTQIGALPEHLLRSWVESRLPKGER